MYKVLQKPKHKLLPYCYYFHLNLKAPCEEGRADLVPVPPMRGKHQRTHHFSVMYGNAEGHLVYQWVRGSNKIFKKR